MILGAFIAYIVSRSVGPNGSGQFQGLLGTILSCLLPVLRSFLAGWNVVTLKGTAMQTNFRREIYHIPNREIMQIVY